MSGAIEKTNKFIIIIINHSYKGREENKTNSYTRISIQTENWRLSYLLYRERLQ